MNRQEKHKQVDHLSQWFDNNPLALFADYRGVPVSELTELRRKLREVGSSAQVVKNNLARLAFTNVNKDVDSEDCKKLLGLFQGPNLMAVAADDVVGAAKAYTKFASDNEAFKIKGAWFNGSFLAEKEVVALSKMPSREETLAKLLSLLNTPATQVLQLLNAPATQLIRVIDAQRSKLEGGS